MILLCGIPSESPLALVGQALDQIDAPYLWFNQRHFSDSALSFDIDDRGVTGWLEIDGRGVPLESVRGIYSRLMDHAKLPELRGEPADSPLTAQRRRCRACRVRSNRNCSLFSMCLPCALSRRISRGVAFVTMCLSP